MNEVQQKTLKISEEARWLFRAGEQYKNAFYLLIGEFSVVSGSWNNDIEWPSYYCGGFAFESFFKSYLKIRRINFTKIHDLGALMDLDKTEMVAFFEFQEAEIFQIKMLNERYDYHESYGKYDLRYPTKPGLRKSPHPDGLNSILNKMYRKLMEESPKIKPDVTE